MYTRNPTIAVPVLLALVILSGCVTKSPEALFDTSQPIGSAQNTGKFPTIGQVPVGETRQISKVEAVREKAELKRLSDRQAAKEAADAQAAYLKEVKSLQDQVKTLEKKRLKEIEEGSL